MKINSITATPQQNITNKNVAFKGFTSSISAEEFTKAAGALKGQKGWSFVSDKFIASSLERFKTLTAKLKAKFEAHPSIDLHLMKENQSLWVCLLPSEEAASNMPLAGFGSGLARMKHNFMFAEHENFLKEIDAAAAEIELDLKPYLQTYQ